jgi:putative component of membrane protein insertase Oxa1/YidC/SpoIIIJ protein YidD
MLNLWSGVALATLVATAPSAVAAAPSAVAADHEAQLWQPAEAVAFLLATPTEATGAEAVDDQPPRWNGALGGGVTRALFGTYRVVLSSQDLPVCAFNPSCSRFSQRAIGRCGFIEGALLSLDRLLRDHPLAAAFYPVDEGGKLLKDDPARYCLTAPR